MTRMLGWLIMIFALLVGVAFVSWAVAIVVCAAVDLWHWVTGKRDAE